MKNKFLPALILIIVLLLLNYGCKPVTNEGINVLTFAGEGRSELLFDAGWRFYRGDTAGAESVKFDDSSWRAVNLPHDWSIEDLPGTNSPFDPEAISQVSGGFTTGGTGWYRKSFTLTDAKSVKRLLIQFEGIYMNPEIWMNGISLGNHPYGYTSFWYDITDKIIRDGTNVLAVKVRNEGANSRWYSGSGIYRHVWLTSVEPVSIAQWGTNISTTFLNVDSAKIIIRTKVNNYTAVDQNIKIVSRVLNMKGEEAGRTVFDQKFKKSGFYEVAGEVSIIKPDLWSTESPNLYTAVTELYSADKLIDRSETKFGLRTIMFSGANGFILNGKPMKLQGGCYHHDNGLLGSKSYDRAEERRIELLKASGFNAIRCSHNPPSPSFLEACDRLGMLVIDEAFDMWKDPKNPSDYHLYFNDWWKRDVESMVLRDRNHPSVIMWSIGNEIPNRQTPEVVALAKNIGDLIHMLDPSRPVTSAVNDLKPDKDPYFATLDIAGYNYASGGDHLKNNLYVLDHKRVPGRIMAGLESYPLEAFSAWMDVIDNPFVIGDFVWTAWDYIGEASIGWRGYMQEKNFYPWNLAYCGDIDICGWKRPQSYYRDALWKKNQLSVFVTPPRPSFEPNPKRESWSKWHWYDVVDDWNWKGYENTPFEITVYSSCESVELFLNNKSLGMKKTNRSTEFKATWEVPYQAGELKSIGYTDGKIVNTASLKTAGEPSVIKLTADRNELKASGEDLSYITVELIDDKGIRNPKSDDLVKFEIEGPGIIEGVGNANPISTESCVVPERKAWHGRCMVVIRSKNDAGKIVLKASSGNLIPDSIGIESGTINWQNNLAGKK